MKILAIETSCDETGIASIEVKNGKKLVFKILSNQLASQVKVHRKYGGVVPRLAKREHQQNLPILLNKALKESKLFRAKPKIDAIAVTHGPGLEPSLWVGVNFAKTLALAWKLPLVAINHLEAHIFSFIIHHENINPKELFPFLALIVSGGHTELIYSPSLLKYKLLGETLDDAAGEAFDKAARLLGFPYPGGPELAKLATKGSPTSYHFPRPMINSKDLNFSFAGLKTAFLYKIQSLKTINYPPERLRSFSRAGKLKTDLSASFEQAIIDVLVKKTIKAIRKHNPRSFIIGGGVTANDLLRKTLKEKIEKEFPKINLFFPKKEFTTDNAVMIAVAAYFHALKKDFIKPKKLKAQANLKL